MHTNIHLARARAAVFAAALILASAYALRHLGARIGYELTAPFTADTTLYWAVGRGILNGYAPYIDLFENKPPGIFLLSALSFLTTGGIGLTTLAQVASLLVIPACMVWMTVRSPGAASPARLFSGAAAAFVLGALITLYAAERSGEVQVESFGAAFVILYASLLLKPARQWSIRRTCAASLFLLCAIGLKEPFLLSAIAVALIACANRLRDLSRVLLLPLAAACSVGAAAMIFLGFLSGYLRVYLPEMFFNHVPGAGPLWARGLRWEMLVSDVGSYSPWLLHILIFGIAVAAVIRWERMRCPSSHVASSAAWIVALYLTILAVGMGGHYWNHHFVFAVPTYAVVVALALRAIIGFRSRFSTAVLLLVLITGIVGIHGLRDEAYAARSAMWVRETRIMRTAAAQVDDILDRCGLEQYLFLGGNGSQPYAFTRHTPYGPLFYQYDYLVDGSRPEFRQSFLQNLEDADFAVVSGYGQLADLQDHVRRYMEGAFTAEAWPCARGLGGQEPFTFLFRKGAALAQN